MIKNQDVPIYPLQTVYGIMSEFPVFDFCPSDADGLLTDDGEDFITAPEERKQYYYDRIHRGKSWFYLDLAIDPNRRKAHYPSNSV